MKIQTKQAGFSALLAIFIIAVISVGGYAAVQYSQQQKAEVNSMEQEKEILVETKTKVKDGLLNVQATLKSNLGLEAKVKAASETITDLKALLADARVDADANTQLEITVLQNKIDQLELEIKSNTSTALDSVSDFIDDVSDSMKDDAKMEDEGDTMMENDSMNPGSDTMIKIDSDTDVMTDDTNTSGSMEVDANLETSLLNN